MNRERILKVADAIEQHSISDLGFNLAEWIEEGEVDRSGHNCGTVACIAGWSFAVKNEGDFTARTTHGHLMDDAQIYLGLDYPTAIALFNPGRLIYSLDKGYEDVGPVHAVRVLRHLADTGEVDWSVAWKETP